MRIFSGISIHRFQVELEFGKVNFINVYDQEDPPSLKYICLKCNNPANMCCLIMRELSFAKSLPTSPFFEALIWQVRDTSMLQITLKVAHPYIYSRVSGIFEASFLTENMSPISLEFWHP